MASESRLVRALSAPTNGGHRVGPRVNQVECADGFTMSVISGGGTYCSPRPALCAAEVGGQCPMVWRDEVPCDYPGPFTELEVGFPSERPEPWDVWRRFSAGGEWQDDIFPYVPILHIAELILLHGGEIDYPPDAV